MDDIVNHAYSSQEAVQAPDSCSNSLGCNWFGPLTAYQYLPSKIEWKNPKIIAPGTRSIKNEKNETLTGTGSDSSNSTGSPFSIKSFKYINKVARLLTAQEINSACGITVKNARVGELDECIYLLENTDYEDSNFGYNNYWIETPSSYSSYKTYFVSGPGRSVSSSHVNNSSSSMWVRPAITVKTSDIEK